MTEEEARAILENSVAWATHPVLTEDQIDALLVAARRPDANGLLPGDEGWIPTWDLNAGAADGWEYKAGLVAGGYDFGEDGQHFNRSQMYAQFIAQADRFRRRSLGGSTFRAATLVSPYSGPVETSLLDFGDA